MAREKINYNECVLQSDLNYVSRITRPDEMDNIYEPGIKIRSQRFYSADPYGNKPADILGLKNNRELQWYYLEVREKMVSRPQIDRDGTPMVGKREMRPKFTKIKFVKLEPDEITDSIRSRAKILPICEINLVPIETKEGTDTTQPEKPKVRRVSSAKKGRKTA